PPSTWSTQTPSASTSTAHPAWCRPPLHGSSRDDAAGLLGRHRRGWITTPVSGYHRPTTNGPRRPPVSTISESIDVDVPVTTAYNQWTQFESFPECMEGVESVVQETDTRSRWSVEVGGATRTFVTEIAEQHPDGRIAWRTVDG